SACPGESHTGAQNCSNASGETQGFSQSPRPNIAITPIAAAAYMPLEAETRTTGFVLVSYPGCSPNTLTPTVRSLSCPASPLRVSSTTRRRKQECLLLLRN